MSLKQRISKAIQDGDEEGRKHGAFFRDWWDYFSLTFNPFEDSPLDPVANEDDAELFAGREEILRDLAVLVGESKYASRRMKVVVIGPYGAGKRSLAHLLYWGTRDSGRKGFVFNVEEDYYVQPEKRTGSELLPEDEDLCFVLLENMKYSERAKMRFDTYDDKKMLIVGFWEPQWIPANIEYDLRMEMPPLNRKQVEELLSKRIQRCGGNARILRSDVLELILDYSQGNPLLAILLTSGAFQTCYQRRGEGPTVADVEEAAESRGYKYKIQPLRSAELKVLKYLAQIQMVTPNGLAKELSISRVMAWKYLNRFYREGFLTRQTVGKSYQYELTKPALVWIQRALMGRD